MSGGGPITWAALSGTVAFTEGFWFDGIFLQDGAFNAFDIAGASPGAVLGTAGGGNINQLLTLGGDVPQTFARLPLDFQIQIAVEEDWKRINRASNTGESIEVWFDLPFQDQWWIPGNKDGTSWKFSRRLPYGEVTGISHATRPPKAWRVTTAGVESSLTVVTGAPATGELQIPDASGYQTATSFAGDFGTTYEYLRVQYHPTWLCRVSSFAFAYREFNNLIFNLSLDEILGGIYTPSPGVQP